MLVIRDIPTTTYPTSVQQSTDGGPECPGPRTEHLNNKTEKKTSSGNAENKKKTDLPPLSRCCTRPTALNVAGLPAYPNSIGRKMNNRNQSVKHNTKSYSNVDRPPGSTSQRGSIRSTV